MMNRNNITIILMCLFLISCVEKNKINDDEISIDLENYIRKSMETFEIPGLSIAVLKDNEVLYKNSLGYASLEDSTLVDDNTMFRIFSTTKLFTVVDIFQLIENGNISLDDRIENYINNTPDKWRDIRIENLLTHSSGLSNMIWFKNDQSDAELMDQLALAEMDFKPGQQFSYNQTNYWFLAKIIEKVKKMPFELYTVNTQFHSNQNDVLFLSNSDTIIEKRANKYNYDYQAKRFNKDKRNDGKRALAGNGLSISINRFIEWDIDLNEDSFISQSTKTKMWSPFEYKNGKRDFLMGWGKYHTNDAISYGFSGGNLSNFRKFIDHDLTIILLSNGYKLNAYDIIVDDIARMCIEGIRENSPTLEAEIFDMVMKKEYQKAKASYKKLVAENPNSGLGNLKWNINKIGNWYLEDENYSEAINIYSINKESLPDWWVSYVGLGEVNEKLGNSTKSIQLYQRAILLNQDNEENYNPVLEKAIMKLKETETNQVDDSAPN